MFLNGDVSRKTPLFSVIWLVRSSARAAKRRRKIKLHLFGFARLRLIPFLMKKRVVSFDTAAPLRQAWESGEYNYHFANPWRSYTAIRIRLTRTRKTRRGLEGKEKETLETMYTYARREVSLGFTLKQLLEYERLILEADGVESGKIKKIIGILRERYTRTLKDRPWEKCDCPICRERGVDVIIFRGGCARAWRNGSRAHHNVRQFYLELNKIRNNAANLRC